MLVKNRAIKNFKKKNEANITIVSKDVEDVVSKWHIFHQEVLQNQIYHYLKLRKKYAKRVFGQDKAINSIVQAIKINKAGLGVDKTNRKLSFYWTNRSW